MRFVLGLVLEVLDQVEDDIRTVALQHALEHPEIVPDVHRAGAIARPAEALDEILVFFHHGRHVDVVLGLERERRGIDGPQFLVFVLIHVIEQHDHRRLGVWHAATRLARS